MTLASGSRCFSFLSVAWGFLSDVDIHSERFRALGSARFTLGAVLGLATLHTYRGRLSYLPATTEGRGLYLLTHELPLRAFAHFPIRLQVSPWGRMTWLY